MARETLVLPVVISSPGDVRRLNRELQALDSFLFQAALRKPGTHLSTLPKSSASLGEFASLNKLNFINPKERLKAIKYLDSVSKNSPVIHISFTADPSAAFTAKLTAWFRRNLNPDMLISIGLEPSIAAGCTLWTDNHMHDFSLRKSFDDQRPLLLKLIRQSGEESDK